MAVLLLFSCTDEETIDTNSDTADLAADLSIYKNSPFGMYKGVFTTNDSQERGVVEIKVINEELAKARVTLNSGEVINYNGRILSNTDGIGNDFALDSGLIAKFKSLSGVDAFDFKVKSDGSLPTVSEVMLNGTPSFISVLKEDSRLALITSTGLYSGGGFSGTWNIVFDSQADADGDSMNFTTQIMVGGNDIGTSTGNAQTMCSDDGTTRMCDIAGVADMSSSITMTWTGMHLSTIAAACSQINGTWMATGPGGTDFSGSFTSDIQCTSPPSGACEGTVSTFDGNAMDDLISNGTPVNSIATSTATGNVGVDADIDNVMLNITHTFDGDLDITLISPTGTSLLLSSDNGAGGANYTGTEFRDGGDDIMAGAPPFTGVFQPQGGTFAAAFDGETVTGDWTLNVVDTFAGDDGSLNSWSISICDENIADSFGSTASEAVVRMRNDQLEGLTKKEFKKRLKKMK